MFRKIKEKDELKTKIRKLKNLAVNYFLTFLGTKNVFYLTVNRS